MNQMMGCREEATENDHLTPQFSSVRQSVSASFSSVLFYGPPAFLFWFTLTVLIDVFPLCQTVNIHFLLEEVERLKALRF